ncbi:conserved hypothetical protein [Planktothrix serta PCC 8927]|uniref:Carboxypeptidase regulatory-like domain-containing protein n=1 Tax=Planktothrix serta PCC 8927 TaxID=671068 RepID=A0A7Z9DYQ2_9CYAN|nr:carboxypeptidase-like regulatory domain-containing protein [Planktothrix serta]VXD16272.1 conserved hypothetical protein [Planktothrix serta PCC 8927]
MKYKWIFVILLFPILTGQERAIAHGAKAEYKITSAIEIQAEYDSGFPLKNAQVTIYAPDNPTQPWKEGITDAQGNFTFTPDTTKTGYWEVKVRQAGHGALITIPIESNNSISSKSTPLTQNNAEFSPLQKGVMIASVIWGCIGTALFFQRTKASPLSSEPGRDIVNAKSQR